MFITASTTIQNVYYSKYRNGPPLNARTTSERPDSSKSAPARLAESAPRGWRQEAGDVAGSVTSLPAIPIRGHVGLPGVSDSAFYAAF